jgi:Glycosyl hydrolase family 26
MSLALIGAVFATVAMAATGPSSSASSPAPQRVSHAATMPTKQQLLDPAHKYFGVSVSGAPASLTAVTGTSSSSVTSLAGKQPSLLMFYNAWNGAGAGGLSTSVVNGIKNACAQGMLPMMTWESWNTSVSISSNPGVAYTQPAFAMSTITAGKYDTYITAVAKQVAALGCPLAIRFDQEENGYWYPWGVSNTNQNGKNTVASGAKYIAMWRHVWTIFHNQGATNVLWTWSPNNQNPANKTLPLLSTSYPGDAYVDWVGIDQYYNATGRTFAAAFDPTITEVKAVAPSKPWLVGETAVGDFPDKPAEIKNLLHNVAVRKRFNGFVYFDQHKNTDRNYWPFQETKASTAAFKAGVDIPAFAAGKPGTL